MTALALKLHDRLGKSLRQISAALEKEGYTGPRGQPYSAAAVRSMLRAEKIALQMDVLDARLKTELEAKGSATTPLERPEKAKSAKKVARR